MPIYEFICRWDGVVEILLPLSDWNRENVPCPHCLRVAHRVEVSECVMRPDTLWAGHVHRNYGYITSQSQLNEEMKRRNHVPVGDRTDREAWDKIADDAQKAKKEKLQKDVRGWSERTFGPSGLGLGGADGEKLMKEAK
jgi:hypothetical protein